MSATLAQETFYCASRLSDGSVLRLAVTENSIWALLLAVLQPAAVVVIVVLILGAILANRVARRIVAPVNALDLEHPEQNDGSYEELSPLLSKIARQKRTIESQLSQAQKRQEQFRLITENMSEGTSGGGRSDQPSKLQRRCAAPAGTVQAAGEPQRPGAQPRRKLSERRARSPLRPPQRRAPGGQRPEPAASGQPRRGRRRYAGAVLLVHGRHRTGSSGRGCGGSSLPTSPTSFKNAPSPPSLALLSF